MTKRLWAYVTHLFLRSEISSGNSLECKKAEKAATLKPNTWPVLVKLGISNSSSILLCDDDDMILMMTYLCRTVGCLWPTSWASSSPPCPEPAPEKYFYQLEKHQIFLSTRETSDLSSSSLPLFLAKALSRYQCCQTNWVIKCAQGWGEREILNFICFKQVNGRIQNN